MGDPTLQSRQAFLKEAEALLEKGDWAAALALATLRLEVLPGDPDARMVSCRSHLLAGRPEEARELLSGMEELLTGIARLYRGAGELFADKGMPEEARTCYHKFISLNPDDPAVIELTARLRQLPGTQGTTAEEDAAQVPEDFQTVTLAELYIRQGHLQMAKEVLEAVLGRDPQHKEAAARLREVMERLKAEPAIAELSRWLGNIGRLRGDAA